MSYMRNEMLYDDGEYYNWQELADDEVKGSYGGNDLAELNRRNGNEVLDFINQLGLRYWSHTPSVKTFQKIEKMIRQDVPENVTIQRRVADWIIINWTLH